ncbi:MAG: HAMP domain-containing sensor histidine kinase, partial [Angelakisella sp.]
YTHLIQVIKRQTKRLIRLSEALLDINSDDTRNMQAYKLQDAIGDILGELKHAAAEKNLAVVAQLGETSIYGAPFLLNRLFTNLVDNAIKYSRAGGSINITATENADSVTVAVADSGAGIPLDEREKIFEPFYRIDKSRSRSIGGAGLGLAICKMAAEKHNATISIADNPNGGSIISVLFPKKY